MDSTRVSKYPDGTQRELPIVSRPRPGPMISNTQVRRVLCHRLDTTKLPTEEQYLVDWRVRSPLQAYSWHNVDELLHCLPKVQKYLHNLADKRRHQAAAGLTLPPFPLSRKRKSPDSDGWNSPASSDASFQSLDPIGSSSGITFYGKVRRTDGRVTIEADPSYTPDDYMTLPTKQMETRALDPQTSTRRAELEIAKRFRKNLATLGGSIDAPVTLEQSSHGTPPLDFVFINSCVLGEGVTAIDSECVVGCGSYTEGSMTCRPDMGQHIGCEYSRICECLELAPVDESRLTLEQHERFEEAVRLDKSKMSLPKKFPYMGLKSRSPGCLIPFYLDRRNEIYECNPRCACGPSCKTRVVQRGRQVPLQIFHTGDRGWGLRCPWFLKKGQFIDTYRGEIITDAQAKLREERGKGKTKNSYLFSLDKFREEDDMANDDIYVIDGEYQGGPTGFMNHSCDPNCGQYVVSFNKYDRKIYELAFFATEDIPAGTELTFDYLDADADVADDPFEGKTQGEREQATPCRCGSSNCRKWLWV